MTNSWIRLQRPLDIAHRGDGVAAPENTLSAYQKAYEAGAEMIETDVNITKDGHLVIIHDGTLDRTTNFTGYVHEYTLEELRRADAGSWFNPMFAGEHIPTIEEAFEFAKKNGIYMCFEVKGRGTARSTAISTQLVEIIREYDAFDSTFMSSYYHDSLAAAKKIAPQLMLAPERLPDDVEPDIPEALRQANDLGAEVLQLHYKYLYPEVIQAMHEADIALWVWPTTTKDEILPAIKRGADAVMGDDPGLALQLINQYYQAN
ncbi:MAG: hypothetical protein J7K66_02545 [Anaerolineaceae bacterium]|nr:hypothetical protein [Anaerolineaceae bacterium]